MTPLAFAAMSLCAAVWLVGLLHDVRKYFRQRKAIAAYLESVRNRSIVIAQECGKLRLLAVEFAIAEERWKIGEEPHLVLSNAKDALCKEAVAFTERMVESKRRETELAAAAGIPEPSDAVTNEEHA